MDNYWVTTTTWNVKIIYYYISKFACDEEITYESK